MNYYANNEKVVISVYDQILYTAGNNEEEGQGLSHFEINNDEYWQRDYQLNIDINIRPNYNYNLFVETTKDKMSIVATFEN